MEQIKESFKHDYNLAVRSFNEKDYKSFFRNIRPAMELLGQLSIYDILGESDAVDLLEGDTSVEWKRDAKIYKISQYPSHHKPTGREFCELVPQVFYSKNTEVTTTRIDEKKKRLKRGLDSCAGALSRYYSIASEFGSHTGGTGMDHNCCALCVLRVGGRGIDCVELVPAGNEVGVLEHTLPVEGVVPLLKSRVSIGVELPCPVYGFRIGFERVVAHVLADKAAVQ